MMNQTITDRWHHLLDSLRAAGRFRSLTPPRGVDFTSNDYLGYSKLVEQPDAALSRSGRASRLLGGHLDIWEQVETALARWHGAPAALMMTSGYQANEGLLSTLVQPGDLLASDEFNHASIIDGARLSKGERFIYRHLDLQHLEDGLKRCAARRRPDQQMFVVTESLFSMDGDRAPLADLAELCQRWEAHLLVDEAHATGCFGATGGGLVDLLGMRDRVLATMHTGGKALGVPGAYVVGSALLKEVLINRCRQLIFTTALPPQVAQWWLQAMARVQTDDAGRARLHARAGAFRQALACLGIPLLGADYIVPVVFGSDEAAVQAAATVQECGYDVRAVRPPTVPHGTARLRISIHADHGEGELYGLAAALKKARIS